MHTNLTEEDVRRIRAAVPYTAAQARIIARSYGIAVSTVQKIWRRDTFIWIPEEPPVNDSAAAESLARLTEVLKGEEK